MYLILFCAAIEQKEQLPGAWIDLSDLTERKEYLDGFGQQQNIHYRIWTKKSRSVFALTQNLTKIIVQIIQSGPTNRIEVFYFNDQLLYISANI